jgi:preprotein translocase subunit SecA
VFSFNQWLQRSAAPLVEEIRHRQLPDASKLRERAGNGEPADDLLVDVFAAVCSAAERVLEQSPYDVQLMAAVAVHRGHIAEMQTGDGDGRSPMVI